MTVSIDDVGEVVRSVWECVLHQNVAPAEAAPAWPANDRLLGTISISGQWTGMIVIEASPPAARQAACRMFSLGDAQLSRDDVRDALAELTNIVGGNVKSLVPGPSCLALPAVTTGDDFDFRLANASLICSAAFRADGNLLRVGVWEKVAVGSSAA